MTNSSTLPPQGVELIRATLEDMRKNGLRSGLPQEHAFTLLDEITQLRGNLSLAEEGLASYALEVERHRATLLQVKQARLDWAMVCECTCAACETFSNVIRLIGRSAVEPTSHEPRSYCPNCDCDYCSSAERLRERGSPEPLEQRLDTYTTGQFWENWNKGLFRMPDGTTRPVPAHYNKPQTDRRMSPELKRISRKRSGICRKQRRNPPNQARPDGRPSSANDWLNASPAVP